MKSFMNWFHSHTHTPIAPTPDNIGPGAPFPIPPANDHPYVNGMKDPVVGGFVTLEVVEQARAKALASGNPKLVTWAKSVLPYRFAIQAAQTQPEFAMSDADKFSNEMNCQYAKMFLFGGLIGKSWCPQAFVATAPLPTEHKLYDQGPAIYGYASFDPTITPADMYVIIGSGMDAAAQ